MLYSYHYTSNLTSIYPPTKKLMKTLPRQMQTTAKMATLVFANIAAPIRQTKRLAVFNKER